jgi:hypothetical protein
MRTLIVLSVIAALVIAADTAAAQQPATPMPAAQADQSMGSIQVNATPDRFKPQPAELSAVMGTYNLDNGAVLRVGSEHRKVTVYHAPNGRPVELIPVGRYVYMASDRSLLMEFNLGELGEDVMVTYSPDSVAAERHGSAGVSIAAR